MHLHGEGISVMMLIPNGLYGLYTTMWMVRGEPSGYHASSVVWNDDSWHDGRPVDDNWLTMERRPDWLFSRILFIDFDRPHWVRIAKVALHYSRKRCGGLKEL